MRSAAASTRKRRASTGSGAAAVSTASIFHFRFPEQGARMAAFLWKQRLHRLVPGRAAPSPDEVTAAWARLAEEREAILTWARSTRMLIEIVQTYRFERRQGAYSSTAHAAAAKVVEKVIRPSPNRRSGRACASNGPNASIASGSGAAASITSCCNAALQLPSPDYGSPHVQSLFGSKQRRGDCRPFRRERPAGARDAGRNQTRRTRDHRAPGRRWTRDAVLALGLPATTGGSRRPSPAPEAGEPRGRPHQSHVGQDGR